ncbi:MAG: rhodanese-like domain-containing protein [Chitinophagaceae bacterium]|nr:rhodanese-like domain-containing protein [Chitinophagaceae bacterium]
MTQKSAIPTIVDVRTNDEYLQAHVKDAINIPLDQVCQRLPEFRRMSLPIVVYCRTGNRSEIAVRLLKQNGIENAINGGSMDEIENKFL